MGRLAGTTIYEIGAMDRVADGGHGGWRSEIKPRLQKMGMFVIDPSDKPISNFDDEFKAREDIHNLKREKKFDEIRKKYKESIRGFDLACVDKAGLIICNLDLSASPVGTYEEWFWANRCKKVVLTRVEGGIEQTPNWLIMCCPGRFFFNTWDEMFEYLEEVDDITKPVETYGRWKFFDWHKLVGETYKAYDFSSHI